MNERERAIAVLTAAWVRGECHYCHVRDAEVDGDKIAWFRPERDLCNQYGCRRRFESAVMQVQIRMAPRRPPKRTPAEIHELKMQERRDARRRSRARKRGAA